MDRIHHFIDAFVPLLVAVDPLGLLPMFVALTATMSVAQRRRVSVQAVLVATVITLAFMLVGNGLFKLLGITMADFQIAGGLLLLLLAITDLLTHGKPGVHDSEMVGLVPLAMPLIAGPATLTTTLVLASRPDVGWGRTSVALLTVYALLLCVLLGSDRIVRLVGTHALTALSKLVMVLLAAIAVSYLRSGVMLVVHDG
jgi:multiple antibiotic resistance protein